MKQFVRYARDVIQFQSLDDLKKEENLDKVIAHMQNDGIGINEQQMLDFGGKFIDPDFMDLVKLMKGNGEGSVQELASNLLGFLSWASNDPKYGKLSLARFSDNIKIAYSQYNANQSFAQADKDREEFKKFDTPPVMRQPEESLEYNSIPEWDSIGHMTLISELEENFKISIETTLNANSTNSLTECCSPVAITKSSGSSCWSINHIDLA